MNFRRRNLDEPEINLIPFIDVLLVVLIFLMLSTTYAKITELKITLPSANAEASQDYPTEIKVTVSSDGRYAVNQFTLPTPSLEALTLALTEASKGNKEAIVVIHADALSTHQAVISVLDAARSSGLPKVTFASQKTNGSP